MSREPFTKAMQARRIKARPGHFGFNSTMRVSEDGIPKESKKRAAERRAESPIRAAYLRAHPRCEIKVVCGHALPDCFEGDLHIHEPWTRARGGPTDDPRNMATACDFHNSLISQDADAQRVAEANDLLVSAQDGPDWLEAGGRMKGKSLEQSYEEIGYAA